MNTPHHTTVPPSPARHWSCALIIIALSASPAFAAKADTTAPAVEAATAIAPTIVPLPALTGPKPHPVEPCEPAELTSAIERGVAFLLADQSPNGSWGSAQRTKGLNIYAPPPGAHEAFRAAVTSLVVMALIDAEPCLPEEQQTAVNSAIDRGGAWLAEHVGRLRRATPDAIYNVWGHAYALQALARLHDRAAGDADEQAKWKDLAQAQADLLARYSFLGGGWSYYDFLAGTQTPGDAAFGFCTATVLVALKEAEAIGVEFPERLTERALTSLRRQQKPDFSYAYGEYTMRDPRFRERPGGSLGRSQVCNLALRLYGDERISDEVLTVWLDRLFARNGWLSMGRKRPVPHESHFSVAGYYYYYGHWYAAMCIGQLPESERAYFQDHLARILLPLQEPDGSWWDYPFYNYHQQYGTAMAIMSLVRCQRAEASLPPAVAASSVKP